MNAEALPYTLLIILMEMAIGSLWVTLAADLRGGVTRGFVLTMSGAAAIVAGLAYWLALSLSIATDIDGYLIDPDWFEPMKTLLLVVTGTSAFYAFMVFMGWDPIGRIVAIGGSVVGVVCVAFLAGMLAPPVWGFPGVLLALLAGTVAMGAVSTSMTWGHWYLTEGSLPGRPLRELAWILIAAAVHGPARHQRRHPRAHHPHPVQPRGRRCSRILFCRIAWACSSPSSSPSLPSAPPRFVPCRAPPASSTSRRLHAPRPWCPVLTAHPI